VTRDAGASRIREAGREALGFEGGTVATVHAPVRIGWIDWAGAVGAILFAVGLLVSFSTSSDHGETAESLIACAEDAELELLVEPDPRPAHADPHRARGARHLPADDRTAERGVFPGFTGTWRRTSWPGRAGPPGSRTTTRTTSGTAMRP
jgi:hypothetical protein